MNRFEYHEPTDIHEAVMLAKSLKGSVKWLAGGTELLVKLKQRVLRPKHVINLKKIPGLQGIKENNGVITIGPLTTLSELSRCLLIRSQATALSEAAGAVASPNIRRLATIGGNLCQGPKCLYYLHKALWDLPPCYLMGGSVCNAVEGAKRCTAMSPVDTAPALLALDAAVEIANSTGVRSMDLQDFFVNPGVTVLASDEILTSIRIPRPGPGTGTAYLKFSARGTIDYAIACVGVRITVDPESKRCSSVRIALGAVDTVPLRAKQAERLMEGEVLSDELVAAVSELASKDAHPWSDIHASSKYRTKLAAVLLRQALLQAHSRAQALER